MGWRLPLGILLALAGLGLGWLWFRDSSLTRVERVVVVGTGSSERDRVRSALETAAEGMSTLHVDGERLRDAVRPFTSVAGLRFAAGFPHDLRIEVVEHEPVAQVEVAGATVPATAGGLLLRGVHADGLPVVRAKGATTAGRLSDPRALEALRVAAAAPAELRARTSRVYAGDGGIRLELRDGPELVFGTAAAAELKWRAAARVLSEESAAGATYLDLRVPKLVAAGGVGPVDPEPTATPTVVPSVPSTAG